jgi:hypothetical protein
MLAAGLLNDQDAAGDVPGVEPLFPEAVEPPGGDVAHIERGRPEPAHGARLREEAAEQPEHLLELLLHRIGEARHEQRVNQSGGGRDADGLAVQERAASAYGREQLVACRIVHGADAQLAVHFERDRRAEERQAVGEVRGAIEGIADPAVTRSFARAGTAEFLPEHVVVRVAARR